VEDGMPRYDKAHKEATRRRIIERAGRRFKRDGIDGSGISALMSDAGLTNGAFYAHFGSKEDLVAAVIEDQVKTQSRRLSLEPLDRAGFEQYVRDYLSTAHRDNAQEGCPSAALLDEIVRSGEGTKRAYTEQMLEMIDGLASLLGEKDPKVAQARALSILASMVGILQLSRALTDEALADEVLAAGLENIRVLMDGRVAVS
jgi:AcrR family transcriptional regulator